MFMRGTQLSAGAATRGRPSVNRWDYGRFMQPDPIGYEAGLNLYGYVGADPVNAVDPTGLTPCDFSDVPATNIKVCGDPGGAASGGGGRPSPAGTGARINEDPLCVADDPQNCLVVIGKRLPPPKKTSKNTHRFGLRYPTLCPASVAFDRLRQPGMSAPGAPYARDGASPRITLYFNNPIRQFVSTKTMTIVNTTLPGHQFHPGSVVIRVTPAGSGSDISFTGIGSGDNPCSTT